jgi:hypothetical protein
MQDCRYATHQPPRGGSRKRHGPTIAHAGRLRTPPTVITTRWPPFGPDEMTAESPPFAVCAPRPGGR